MGRFMLDGWTPILLVGLAFTVVILLLSRKVTRKTLLSISTLLSLMCIVAIIYSIVAVGGWEGMGVAILAASTIIGIWIGTLLGVSSKRKEVLTNS
jgi:CHASE2 domain-containing sensor protein